MTEKQRGIQFKSLKEATDAIVQLDFDKVIAYKIEFRQDPKGEFQYWRASRKILTNYPMGSAKWIVM